MKVGFHLPPDKIMPVGKYNVAVIVENLNQNVLGKKVFKAMRLMAEKINKEYPHLKKLN